MEESTVACYLAARFCVDPEVMALPHFTPVSFLPVQMIEINSSGAAPKFYCMEDLIHVRLHCILCSQPVCGKTLSRFSSFQGVFADSAVREAVRCSHTLVGTANHISSIVHHSSRRPGQNEGDGA